MCSFCPKAAVEEKNRESTSKRWTSTPLCRGHGPSLHRPAPERLRLPGRVRSGMWQRREDLLQRLQCQLQRQISKLKNIPENCLEKCPKKLLFPTVSMQRKLPMPWRLWKQVRVQRWRIEPELQRRRNTRWIHSLRLLQSQSSLHLRQAQRL